MIHLFCHQDLLSESTRIAPSDRCPCYLFKVQDVGDAVILYLYFLILPTDDFHRHFLRKQIFTLFDPPEIRQTLS